MFSRWNNPTVGRRLIPTHYHATGARHVMVWLIVNALVWINVAALHWTQLVLGWITVCVRVNHLGM